MEKKKGAEQNDTQISKSTKGERVGKQRTKIKINVEKRKKVNISLKQEANTEKRKR